MKKTKILAFLFLLNISFLSAQQFAEQSLVDEMNTTLAEFETHEENVLPVGSSVVAIRIEGDSARVMLDISPDFLSEMDDLDFEEIMENLMPIVPDVGVSNIFLEAARAKNEYVDLAYFIEEEKLPTRPQFSSNRDLNLNANVKSPTDFDTDASIAAPPLPSKKAKGGLANKTVWVSAGHGWMYKNNIWKTQRKNHSGVVEDFATIESVNYYLLKYLENAGANVWTVRERDMNKKEIIVDDESSGFSMQGNWSKSTSIGWKKNYRYLYTTGSNTARAIFTPNITESGMYWVSVYYREGGNRSKDARYLVKHAGGESIVSINQEVHGMTWVYLGQFYFDKGTKGSVSLLGQSSDVGQAVIADAVRFGGGMGTVPDAEGGLSNKPRFEEGAIFYTKYQGYPYGENDVTVRPQYAEWELAKGTWQERNNAIYIAWHTNAGGGRGSGTETFMYNGGATRGSYSLRNYIHKELVGDIKKEWDPNWKDRGTKAANFGELRMLRTMPGALIEVGFHDHPNDAKALKTPAFRQLSARAIYQGIARYYAAKDGKKAVFLPEQPTHLMATNAGSGTINLKWQAPAFGGAGGHQATGYRVYISTHGRGFTEGIEVSNTSYTFNNLDPATTYYFKVTATNAGGESFSTAVVAARTPIRNSRKVPFLIVDGFDRLDRYGAIKQYDGSYLGTTNRLFIDRMNNYDYAVEHAKGLEYAGVSFDGATNEAVIKGSISLKDYKAIDWFLGEESSVDYTLDYTEQRLLGEYLDQGGALLISGSEHSYHLAGQRGIAPYFYKKYLKATYAGDDAETYNFSGAPNSFMNDLRGEFDNSLKGSYNVDFPDMLTPYGGSEPILLYSGGNGKTAGVAYKGRDFKVINIAFPLEAIPNEKVRNEIIARSVRYLIELRDGDIEIISDFKRDKKNNEDKGGTSNKSKTNKKPKTTTTTSSSKPVETKTTTTSTTKNSEGKIDLRKMPNPARIAPNPFQSNITLNIKRFDTGKAKLTLYNARGKVVYMVKWKHRKGNMKSLELPNRLENGLYEYEVEIGGRAMKGKILKRE